jgi:hypothetical protein
MIFILSSGFAALFTLLPSSTLDFGYFQRSRDGIELK